MDGERCEAILKKTNKQCLRPVKHVSKDGKFYCGYHNRLACADADEHVSTTTHSENENAKKILSIFVSLCLKTLQKFTYLIILLVIMGIVHAYAKAYYYHTCDSNLLKAWLFKKSTTCTVLAQIVDNVETWSLKHGLIITRHVIGAASEVPSFIHALM